MIRCSYKKMSLSFTIISCAAATTRKFVNKMRASGALNLNKLDRRVFVWNTILNEQEGS